VEARIDLRLDDDVGPRLKSAVSQGRGDAPQADTGDEENALCGAWKAPKSTLGATGASDRARYYF
jgi:hypothetical protein